MFEHVCSTRWHCCTYGKVCMCVRMLGVSGGKCTWMYVREVLRDKGTCLAVETSKDKP